MLEFLIEDEFLVIDKAWFYQNKISNVDNERATPNDEYKALSQEIRFPFNNKLRLATDLINLSGLTDISH